jgi:CheY-specific phosphatase CheX
MTDSYNAIADEIRQLFINATAHTLSVQCNVKSTHTGSFQKGKQEQQPFDIGGIIGITSPNIKGTATLCFPKAIFLQIIQSMFDE